jgi:FG-GAP-like repeat
VHAISSTYQTMRITRAGLRRRRRGVRGALCATVILVAMAMAMAMAVGTSAAGASLTLFSGPTYPFGGATDTSPVALAALGPGGATDLVAVDRLTPGSIMVRLGNGDGTFGPPVDYSVTGAVTQLLVADVNKDGKPDVIVVDQEGFSVLLGNGDGTLKPAVRYTPLSNNATRIAGFAVGDFNSDGYPDVVFGGCTIGGPLSSGRLVVWLNQGNGTFAAGSISANGACPEEVVAGRFHGNGHPDDAVVLENGFVTIHAANGDGTLQGGVSIGGPLAPPSQSYEPLATGDFNGDRNLDVAWATNTLGTQNMLMFPGDGNGSFGAPIATNLTPESAGFLAVADFNQDGIDDLAATPSGVFWNGAQVYLGTSSGHFILGNTEPLQAGPLAGTQVAAGDIDGDGYPDLVVAGHGTITPYLNGSLVSFGSEFAELGTVFQGASSADQTVTIGNAGDPPLHISSVEIVPVPEAPGNAPQDFAIDENGCSGQTLPAGAGQCGITVRFTPSGAGERVAVLQVNSNSPESPSFQVLVGVGAAPPISTTSRAISASPVSLAGAAGMTHATVKGGTVSTLLSCAGHAGANCNITLTMTVTETEKGAKLIAVTAAKKRAKVFKRTVVLATKSLMLTAGQSETVHIKLNPTGLRLLARRRVLRAALIATQMSGATTTIVSRQTVSFKTSRKR